MILVPLSPVRSQGAARADGPRAMGAWLVAHLMLVGTLLGGVALAAGWLLTPDHPVAAASSVALCYLTCSPYAVRASLESLRAVRIDANVMMVLGAAVCAFMGETAEGGVLLFLFALAGALEKMATGRAERAIEDLGRRFPTEAIVERHGQRLTVKLAEVLEGDRLIVRPGDRVACDGIVREGESHVDESAITGEFMPNAKRPGDSVYAGSLNGDSALAVQVTRPAAESTLARVSALVSAARAEKTPLETTIERVGRWYGPAVLGFAALVMIMAATAYHEPLSRALYRAITVMIVASPCALMISTPVPTLCAIANAARHGIITRGGRNFEKLAAAHTLFVDKTGTLTTGQIRIAAVRGVNGVPIEQIVAVAAGLERDSTHPLASAVLAHARAHGIAPADVADLKHHAGRGVTGTTHGRPWRMGRPEWAAEAAGDEHRAALLHAAAEEAQAGRTAVVLAGDGGGVLSFEDSMRSGVAEFVSELRELGMNRVELLTGDRRGVAQAVARQAGLDACHAELLPEDKLAHVSRAVRERPGVVMVGDGVNDAPALARADVGVGMGGIGSHTALESSDFVLLNDRVELLSGLLRLARAAHRITRQNIVFALTVIACLACWAAVAQHPRLALGVVGHEGSTVLVALNGLRVLSGRVFGAQAAPPAAKQGWEKHGEPASATRVESPA